MIMEGVIDMTTNIDKRLIEIGEKAKAASRKLAFAGTQAKNDALLAMAEALLENQERILAANALDINAAKEKGLRSSLVNRLLLNEKAIVGMSNALKEVISLPDPVGGGEFWTRPNGLRIQKSRVPLGVIAMVYEARPNVTVDAAALCLKSGNACILRGGSEAIQSNIVLAEVIREAAIKAGMPEGSIQLVTLTDREYVLQLMRMNKYIDAIIPRGGAGLIQSVLENSKIPVIETGTGVCHAFVHNKGDLAKAVEVVFNSKTQNPGVCNSLETLLVEESVATEFLPMMGERFRQFGVEIRGCDKTTKIIDYAIAAEEEDWGAEYLDLIISVRVVKDLDEALDHIYQYGTKHSETIITEGLFGSPKIFK